MDKIITFLFILKIIRQAPKNIKIFPNALRTKTPKLFFIISISLLYLDTISPTVWLS